jgi:hypothetical protein
MTVPQFSTAIARQFHEENEEIGAETEDLLAGCIVSG